MNRAHYEREKLRIERETQLRIVAEALGNADPDYVLHATGFWLERWKGKRRAIWGTHRKPCQPTSPSPTNSTSLSAVNSDFSLST